MLVVGRNETAEARPLVLGDWSETEHWIIEEGLAPGDRVIVDHLMMVRPGMAVVAEDELETTKDE